MPLCDLVYSLVFWCGNEQQEAQLPQRDSASAMHVFLGSLSDRALLSLKLLVRKPSLAWNSHSRSFYVTHFAIKYRPTRGIISPYNIAGL